MPSVPVTEPVVICVATGIEARLLPEPGDAARLLQCGLGAAQLRRPAFAPTGRGLVSFGFAGGLAPELPCGTLLLPRRLRARDGCFWAVHQSWREEVEATIRSGPPPSSDGDLADTREVIGSASVKRALHASSGAVAADMESATLAKLAAGAGIPFLAFRVIIDEAGEALPRAVINVARADGRLRWPGLLRALATSPRAFWHFTCAYRRASQALASAAARAWPVLIRGAYREG
jgi:hypothetical protein